MLSSRKFKQLVGVIGGTGPEATNYFTSLLVRYRGHVSQDQDHIPFLVFNNTQIPDRSKYLMYDGENPLPEMINTGLLLKQAGATFLVIPCNTAHALVGDLEKGVGLPVMNMVEETAKHILNKYGESVTVGLLATSGTMHSKVYENTFKTVSPKIKLLTPDDQTQKEVMKACYDIKKFSVDNNNFEILYNAAKELKNQGADVIILGCTEIPLALTKDKCTFERLDPMEVLAKKVIEKTIADQQHVSFYRRILNKLPHHT